MKSKAAIKIEYFGKDCLPCPGLLSKNCCAICHCSCSQMLSMRKSMKLGSSTGCRHYNTLAVTGLWPWRQLNLRVLEILLHCMWKGEHTDWMCTQIHINLTAFKCRDFFSDTLLYTKPVKPSPHLSQMTQIHPQSILAVQHQDLRCPTCHHLPGCR